jgi:hypothetical protein
MERLENKYANLTKSMAVCDRSIELYKHPRKGASLAEYEAYTASVIKHFELFFEMLWKFFKVYLLAQMFLVQKRYSGDVMITI